MAVKTPITVGLELKTDAEESKRRLFDLAEQICDELPKQRNHQTRRFEELSSVVNNAVDGLREMIAADYWATRKLSESIDHCLAAGVRLEAEDRSAEPAKVPTWEWKPVWDPPDRFKPVLVECDNGKIHVAGYCRSDRAWYTYPRRPSLTLDRISGVKWWAEIPKRNE